jgi:hypothetical protein
MSLSLKIVLCITSLGVLFVTLPKFLTSHDDAAVVCDEQALSQFSENDRLEGVVIERYIKGKLESRIEISHLEIVR